MMVTVKRRNCEIIGSGDNVRAICEQHKSDLRGADLRLADLRGADLREADLREADLIGADLIGADLRGADLREADFREATLCAANIDGARVGVGLAGYGPIIATLTNEEWARVQAARQRLTTRGVRNLREYLPKDFPEIVCLCGSTRFMDAFHSVGWQLTLDGYIVLTVGVCKHAEHHGGEALGQEVADRLDELHLRKIDLSDLVYVLNVDGYIGESTKKEIAYAMECEKRMTFLEP